MADKFLADEIASGLKDAVKQATTEKSLPPPPPTRLRHDPNRPISEYDETDENNRLHIAKNEFPEGFDLQWVTTSILGRAETQYRGTFERKGWVPILTDDFEGRFKRFMPDDYKGEVEVDGLVLMARPMTFTQKARQMEKREALSRIAIKEKQIMGGEIDKVSLDSRDPSALRYNKIGKSYETISVPDDQGK